MLQRLALISFVTALVGCATTQQQAPLPDPQTVPRQQWSDALTVFDAMGLKGQRDIPKELLGQAQEQSQAANVSAGAGDLAVGPSAGLGLGLFLLGGGGSPAEGLPQIAAWVPAELASTPEEATALVAKEWDQARLRVFKTDLASIPTTTAKYPYGWSAKIAYASMKEYYLGQPLQPDKGPLVAPAFIKHQQVYGPIFVFPTQLPVDQSRHDLTAPQAMSELAKNLPDWFYLYYPGSKYSKEVHPAGVFNGIRTLRFVSK
ncbi:hypothetical protein N5C93_27460 [Pseudomonas nitroreducens]|uniref:Lipoprotein n=1 Tax=Pseudomonas nitroreducens TaxID=46680 RepID=A0ABS0KNB6_PSENT|nr:hypothetical protein [Pseudomonas nitroreducens]MBG6289458.1 hypothetical protein [Pseudomonas nitroreducens]MDG9857330.1 hypothetical protein [Pseudomonas nitroreducens]MDH1076576.1 hypothetical protein [Pseudomonas nitroreducens]